MANKPDTNLVVALDIGTSKIVALIGESTESGQLQLIGHGTHPSHGLKRGVVVNIEATVQSIQRALQEAELMAGCEIHSAFTGIAGSHISSLNSHGIVAIRDREVQRSDVERVIEAAKAVAIPADQKVLHVLPQEFIIDNQEGVREPIGMSGVRLEAKVHIVTGAVSAALNVIKCVRRCGLQVNSLVLEPLASSYAVLNDEEKELGVCLIDIGGGTTDLAIFTENAIRHTAVIPIAGDHATNDVAVALRTPTRAAEIIKINSGSVLPERVQEKEMIEVPSASKRPPKSLPRKSLTHVLQARYEELFQLILAELRRSGFEDLISSGVVLTGGGSKVDGACELAEKIFKMPVRIGCPGNIKGLSEIKNNPIYSTGVGLLQYGAQQRGEQPMRPLESIGAKNLWSRMRRWFHSNL